MERRHPDFDWVVDYVISDGATSISSSAKKIWPELKSWLQCLFHVVRNLLAKLGALIARKIVGAKLRKCLKTLSFVWSLAVFVAGWAALRSAVRAFLANVQKEYFDQRIYWFSPGHPRWHALRA